MVDANGLPATSIATLVSHLGEELLVYASRPFPTRAIASHLCGACTETRALLHTRACAHGHCSATQCCYARHVSLPPSCEGPTGVSHGGIPRGPAVYRQCCGAPRVPTVAVTYPSSPKSPSQCAGHRRPRQCTRPSLCRCAANTTERDLGLPWATPPPLQVRQASAAQERSGGLHAAPEVTPFCADSPAACLMRAPACARLARRAQLPCEQTAAELVEERLEYF